MTLVPPELNLNVLIISYQLLVISYRDINRLVHGLQYNIFRIFNGCINAWNKRAVNDKAIKNKLRGDFDVFGRFYRIFFSLER